VWVDSWPQAESAADGSFTIAHAPSDWTALSATTSTLVGIARPEAVPLVITMKPARRLSGMVRDAKTKQPVAGAQVIVSRQGETGPSATTDARGQYTIPALPPGLYWASVTRPGYAAKYPGGDDANGVDLRKAEAGRYDVELTPLRRVSGRVQDEKSRPVEGALVMPGVQGLGTFYGNPELLSGIHRGQEEVVPTRSAQDGTFTLTLPGDGDEDEDFGGLQPQLVALKQGYAAGTTKLPRTGGPITITLPRGVTLSGRVQAADGTPVPDAGIALGETGPLMSMSSLLSVSLFARSNETPFGDPATEWARSDAAGRFTLNVHPVLHQLSFHKHGFAPRLVEAFDPRSGEELVVVLEPGAEVRGQVVGHDGQAIAGATVTLQDPTEAVAGTTVSLPDGAFVLEDVHAGPYLLIAVKSGTTGVSTRRSVEAPARDVRLEFGAAVTVRGRVTDAATHNAVPRFAVNVHPAVDLTPEDGLLGDRSQAFATTDGSFVMEDVPLGDSTLTVTADGYRTKTLEEISISDDAGTSEIEVALETGLTVRGRVTATDGTGVADALVSTTAADRGTQTDENGDYELKAMAPGEARLDFTKQGFRSAHRTVQVQQGLRLDVTLSRGLSLRGVVVADEAGVAQAHVSANSSAADGETQSAVTDAAGHFTLQGLSAGRYEVNAVAEDVGTAELHDVDVETAGALRLVLERPATAVLTGTVVGLGEQAATRPPMVMVQVQSEEGHASQGAVAEMSGTFRIEKAPAGRVTVVGQAVSADGSTRSSLSKELTLVAGSENSTVVEFRDELVVSGFVVRAGLALPGVTVSFHGPNPGIDTGATSRTDHEGHYEVNLAPGTYSVDASGAAGVSYQTQYVAVESATFDIDVTGGALHGRVVEAGTDTPVPGVDVSLWTVGGSESSPANTTQSGAQGTFEVSSLREGRYRLTTTKKGFGQQVREIELQRGATADVLLELEPADGVSVKVVDARDNRTLDAIVVVRDLARRIVANRHAGAEKDGTVTLALANGPYLLSVSATGYGTITAPITAPTRGLQIGLTPGGTLVIESPRKLQGRIRLVQPDGEDYVSCWCNGIAEITLTGRRTTIEHITPGHYNVVLVDAPESPPRPVDITEGSVSTLTIE
jgi:hypothetical protein